MADNIELTLKNYLEQALSKFEKSVSEKVLVAGAAAMARVIYEEIKLNVTPPRLGVKTGNLQKAVYRYYDTQRSKSDRKTYLASWNHKIAPHGHLLEFGTSRAPAHPFVRPAAARLGDAIEAGKKRMAEKLTEL